MQPRQLSVCIARFPYGGNGSTQSEHPDVGDWVADTQMKAKSDERIGAFSRARYTDTPITMTRNRAIRDAKLAGIDVLVMVDSDQAPDMYLGVDPFAKPFFGSSFDFLYAHYEQGPVCVFAPYCGPPGHPVRGGFENVYVFRWEGFHTGHMENLFKMEAYSRHEAAKMTGIGQADAGPTGVCMIDMRLFDVIGKPYFDYEWAGEDKMCRDCGQPLPGLRDEKASTEDVYFFRNVALNAVEKLGYNPVFCNWDAWAGHWKPWCVGKPIEMTSDKVGRHLREAVRRGEQSEVRIINARPSLRLASLRNGHGKPDVRGTKVVLPGEIDTGTPGEEKPENLGHVTAPEDLAALAGVFTEWASLLPPRDGTIEIVEVGSWTGKSALVIAQTMERMGLRYHLTCVDHWRGNDNDRLSKVVQWIDPEQVFCQFKANIGDRLDKTISFIRADSVDAAATFGECDAVFLDAGHSYAELYSDLGAWMPHVVQGGLVCGHDYDDQKFPGVCQAVREWFGNVTSKSRIWSIIRHNRCLNGEKLAEVS